MSAEANKSDDPAKPVLEAECKRIKERRAKAEIPEGNPSTDAIGLGLSGGGIRSAVFNLGLLQAMHHHGFFKHVDYLSTVSGGGYIGSSLSWFMSRLGGDFPYGSKREDYGKLGGQILAWIRRHGSYLTPGNGLNNWALAAAVLRGTALNLAVFLPVAFALIYILLSYDLFPVIESAGIVLSALLLLMYLLYALISGSVLEKDIVLREWVSIIFGLFLKMAVIFLVIASIPHVWSFLAIHLDEWKEYLFSLTTLSGIISAALTARGSKLSNEMSGYRAWLLPIALTLFIYGLFLWMYHIALVYLYDNYCEWILLGAAGSLALGLLVNINHISMHRYYRDRLLTAFMHKPALDEHGSAEEDKEVLRRATKCLLKDIPQTSAPYHLINTNMITVGSRNLKLRARGGDNLIFSPLYSGALSTGYAPNDKFINGRMDLASAMTISGAAVDPNTGVTRSRAMAFLMTLFNFRLGYWTCNPRFTSSRVLNSWLRPLWHLALLREMLGLRLDEESWFVHLSDGGHFENLGLYELVRRKCRYIIISDAGADPGWTFGDLAKAIELVRVDFGAEIDIDTRYLRPDEKHRISREPYVVGTITYNNGDKGRLLYIKTCVVDGLPEDIFSYRRTNKAFPDQTTTDQFFDEPQFEAYRELGFQLGRRAFAKKTNDHWDEKTFPDEVFEA